MADIILYNDQDQEETLSGVEQITVRSPGGTEIFVQGSAVISAQEVTTSIIDRSISGEYTNADVTKIGQYALCYCRSLLEVNLPQCETVLTYAFAHCDALVTANIPAAKSIADHAFLNCKNLSTVNLTSAASLSTQAFAYCLALAVVNTPKAESISDYAFMNCSALTTLILSGSQICSLANVNAFSRTPIKTSQTSGYIYVPDDLVESYKAATNWSTYAAKIKPISELNT